MTTSSHAAGFQTIFNQSKTVRSIDKQKLTADERITVKNAARELLQKLKQLGTGKPFWYKSRQEQSQVKETIKIALHKDLPESYDKFVFNNKCDEVYNLIYERTISSGDAFYH